MNMTQYKEYEYADSDRLNFADQKAKQEAEAAQENAKEREEELKAKLEAGQISQAEYDTLSYSGSNTDADLVFKVAPEIDNHIVESLTDEDYQYLNLK